MTGDSSHVIYPQYCFHLSPTIEKWCAFRAREIHGLTSHRGFEGQDLYFHLNHPIRWVQIAGVVVAIDEFYGRRIYTIDDSSGANIECMITVPKQNANQAAILATEAEGNAYGKPVIKDIKKTTAKSMQVATKEDEEVKPVVDSEVDVGDVLLVKGKITVYRNNKQIKVHRISHLRSTQGEVQFWKKMTDFHDSVLARPWMLTEKELKRCRREAEKSMWEEPKGHKRSKRKAREAGGTGLEPTKAKKLVRPEFDTERSSRAKVTGLEKGNVTLVERATKASKTRSSNSTRDKVVPSGVKATGLEKGTAKFIESAGFETAKALHARITTSVRDSQVPSRMRVTGLESGSTRLEPVYAESDSILDMLATSTFDDTSFMETRSTGLERTSTQATSITGMSSILSPSTRDASTKLRSIGLDRAIIPPSSQPRRSRSPPTSRTRRPTKAKVTGLEPGNTQTTKDARNKSTSASDTEWDTLVPVRRSFTKVKASGLEKGSTFVAGSAGKKPSSTSRTDYDELLPPTRDPTRSRATGLERKPKRVKTTHVEEMGV